jgi:hypothetical protein
MSQYLLIMRKLELKNIFFVALSLIVISAPASSATLQDCRKKIVGPYLSSLCRGQGATGNMQACAQRVAEQNREQIQACVKGR